MKALKKAFGGTQPKDPTGLTKNLTRTQAVKQGNSFTGKTSDRHAENTRKNEAARQDKTIADAQKARPGYVSQKGKKIGSVVSNTKGLEDRMIGASAIGETGAYGKALGAVDAMNAEANQVGDSLWAKERKNEARGLRDMNNDAAAEESRRGVASGMASMMAQGGAGGGSRERMENQANRANMMASQRNNAQAAQQLLGISADDASQKAQMRQGLAGQYGNLDQTEQSRLSGNNAMEMNKANAWGNMAANESSQNFQGRQFDSQMRAADAQGRNQFNQNVYSENMAGLGARETANMQGRPVRKSSGYLAPLADLFSGG